METKLIRYRRWFIVLVVLVLGLGTLGVVYALQSRHDPADTITVGPGEYDSRIGTANDKNTFAITVDEIKLVSGPTHIRVKKGASVRINIKAIDEEAKLKLEGYDIITESSPEAPGAFSFIADKTGTFAFYAISEQEPGEEDPPQQYKLGVVEVN